ncbi:hypothetical protein, variant 1, partial [Aphanomyces astaci]
MDELPSKLRDTTALCWAAGTGNVDMLRRLLTEGVDVNLADYDRRTPLHIAASDGNAEIVKLLIQAGANCHAKDRWGVTPLDCAKDAVVASLMSTHIRASLFADTSTAPYRRVGSHNDALDALDANRPKNVLGEVHQVFAAIATGDTDTLKRAWLDGLALNAVDGAGRTALHVAVEKEQMNAIELLLSAGATVDVADEQGRTPMSIAVEMNASNVLSLFRRHVYTASSLPQVPITLDVPHAFAAIQHDDLARLQQLVPRLVHPDVQDYDARSLLHVAASEGRTSIVQFLVQVGANVNLLDRWGNSPLSEAMHFAHTDVATYLRDHHATEHGLDDNSLAKSPHQLDSTLLNTALEHILRCVCRQHKWQVGEVFVPIKDENTNGCALVLHNVWFRHTYNDTLPLQPLAQFRKARGMMLLDPGHDLAGRVYSGQQPEWVASLHTTSQSKFFFVPHARKAGLKAVVAVPMVHTLSVVAVLVWYATEALPEDPDEVHRIQRLVKAVVLLCVLRHESTATMSRFQYCQALEHACTGQGELTAVDTVAPDDAAVHDVVSLCISWHLFDYAMKLATSMSSEDHLATIDLFGALVALLKRGFFDDVVGPTLLDLEPCDVVDSISTKLHLVHVVVYVLAYLTTVSPTEGSVYSKSHLFQDELRQYVANLQPIGLDGSNSSSSDDMEEGIPTTTTQTTESAEVVEPLGIHPTPVVVECVLCKFKVPGHIHPGLPRPSVAPSPPPRTPQSSIFTRLRSPVWREFQELPCTLANEWDRFRGKDKLASTPSQDSFRSAKWTTSDVYDTVGNAHDNQTLFRRSPVGVGDRSRVLAVLNAILDDTSAMLTFDQITALHEAIFEQGHDGGAIREDAAVGYASERIYRVFLPSVEIELALRQYVTTLNDPTALPHPLVRAYYAFAALVFYIHPFYDGNGR